MPPMVPLARPDLGAAEEAAAMRVLRSGWLTQGAEVAAFEQEFAAFVGAPHACAVSSCTTALHLALHALGIGPGDEVVTVSHSFIATANAIRTCGAEPVFVDIDAATFNIDPARVAEAVTPRSRAILAVHQMGMPCDMPALLAIAEAAGLPVIEDAACAAGSECLADGQWQRVGRPLGTVACFSFHPRKVITTGEGGMLTTRDADLDRRFRLLRQHGMSVPDTARHASPTVVFEDYLEPGFNYRLTDLQAAIGRVQLQRLPEIVARRRALAAAYDTRLAELAGFVAPAEPAWARSNWQSYCVRLPQRLEQRQAMQALLDLGISTRRGIMCAHREPPYRGTARRLLPQSEQAQDRCLLLPLYPAMTDDTLDRVCAALARLA